MCVVKSQELLFKFVFFNVKFSFNALQSHQMFITEALPPARSSPTQICSNIYDQPAVQSDNWIHGF